jgi:hypothetical protein
LGRPLRSQGMAPCIRMGTAMWKAGGYMRALNDDQTFLF